jgi:HEAT repeat protein
MEKKWIDKSLGRFRFGPIWRERPVDRPIPLPALIALGAMDRAAAVRNVSASALIAHFDAIPDARALAERLLHDRSPAVRERARFALGKADPA